MDNLSSHKRPAVRNAIRSVGARLLFLPPYSPDLNPIEQVFAKLKHLMRNDAHVKCSNPGAMERQRSLDAAKGASKWIGTRRPVRG